MVAIRIASAVKIAFEIESGRVRGGREGKVEGDRRDPGFSRFVFGGKKVEGAAGDSRRSNSSRA